MSDKEFSDIFRRLYMPLGMYALRFTKDVSDAQDIVQEAFAKLWQRAGTTENPLNIKGYLYISVRNIAISRLRSADNANEASISPEDIDSEIPVSDQDIDTSERDARLWKEIDRLPSGCRRVFLLSKRDGLSNSDIADELGISIKTVENQMTKAFSRLRKAFAETSAQSSIFFILPFL